ncbi:MAG: hypothetical protein ACSHYB_08740 [Roseibacillus sp.]
MNRKFHFGGILLVVLIGFALGWKPVEPSLSVSNAAASGKARVPSGSAKKSEFVVTSKQRNEEFQKSWQEVTRKKLKAYSRLAEQRKLLAKWATQDIDAALLAALSESWDGASAWDQKIELRLSNCMGRELAEQADHVLAGVEAGDYGLLEGPLVRSAVLTSLGLSFSQETLERFDSLQDHEIRKVLGAASLSSYDEFESVFDKISERPNFPVDSLLEFDDQEDPFPSSFAGMTAGALKREQLVALYSPEKAQMHKLIIESLALKATWNKEEDPLANIEALPVEIRAGYQDAVIRLAAKK